MQKRSFKRIMIYAEIVTGVHTNGDEHYVTEILFNEKSFYSKLRENDLERFEYIQCAVSPEMYSKIDDEYGITNLGGEDENAHTI